mgnify:CR=1 FL=1
MGQNIIIDFISGGLLTIISIYLINYFSNEKSTKLIGFLYGGPILFAYLAFRIFQDNGIIHAKIFTKYTLLGVISSFGLILPWLNLNKYNINKLLVFSFFYIIIIYAIITPFIININSS